jgi:ferredoxin-type protein NapF
MAGVEKVVKNIGVREISLTLAVVLAIPAGWKGITGFYTWLSPFVLLNSALVLKSFVWLNLPGLMVLVVVFIRKRWFCRRICPVGCLCDFVSSKSPRKTFSLRQIPAIGRWLVYLSLAAAIFGFPALMLLDPMSLFHGFFSAFAEKSSLLIVLSLMGLPLLLGIHLVFPGIWCSKLCPLGGLQDEVFKIGKLFSRKSKKGEMKDGMIEVGRRAFLFSGIGIAAGLTLPGVIKASEKSYLRPPGSVSEKLFNFLCVRCGNCIKSCPTNILTHRADSSDYSSWMVPEVRFTEGYCLENCNLCSRVCPSGSITLFSQDAKKQLFMGLAVLQPENCLLTQNKECDRCKTACSYDAITIEPVTASIGMLPVIHSEKCVGCGACAVICPAETIVIRPLSENNYL